MKAIIHRRRTKASRNYSGARAGQAKLTPLWHNHAFLVLWSGQCISTLGTSASGIAFPLLRLYVTGSPLQAGLVATVGAAAYPIWSLPAGVVADRVNRRTLMVVCDSCRAANLFAVGVAVALGHITAVQLYIAAFIEGSLFTLFNVAQVASLGRVVPREQLGDAYSANQVANNAASVVGPALGGLLFSLRASLPFLADGISYVLSVIFLSIVPGSFAAADPAKSADPPHPLRSLVEGLTWLWRQPVLRFQALLGGGLNFVFAGQGLLVILLAQSGGAPASAIGAIFSVAAVGAVAGALLGGWVQRRYSLGQVMIALTWLQGALWCLYLVDSSVLYLTVITTAVSLVQPISSIANVSYRLALVPDELQGRVNSSHRMVAFAFRPFGVGLVGWLWQFGGHLLTVSFFSAALFALAIATTANPHVRRARVPAT